MSDVKEGDKMILTCDLKRSNPSPTGYSWLIDNHKLIGAMNTYTIVNIQPGHSGSYTCEAKNRFGLGESKPLKIKVQCKFYTSLYTYHVIHEVENAAEVVSP